MLLKKKKNEKGRLQGWGRVNCQKNIHLKQVKKTLKIFK